MNDVPSPADAGPTPPEPPKTTPRVARCRACFAELKPWERKEGFCDDCLRAAQVKLR